MAQRFLLDALPTPVRGVAGELDDVEGIHHLDRVGQLVDGSGLVSGEPVHCDDLDEVSPGLAPFFQPGGEHLFGAALNHVQPGWAFLVPDRGEIDDHRHVLVALTGVPPVGSGCGALSRLPGVGFHSPPAGPGVRCSRTGLST